MATQNSLSTKNKKRDRPSSSTTTQTYPVWNIGIKTLELCVGESQNILCRKDLSDDIPKLVLVFPSMDGILVHRTIKTIKSGYTKLLPITVEPADGGHRRLVVISNDLIQERILTESESSKKDVTSEGISSKKTFVHYCTTLDCMEVLTVPEDSSSSGNEVTNDALAIKDAHLHYVENGVHGFTRQPLSDANWTQLGKSELQEITELCGPVSIIKPNWEYTGNDFLPSTDVDIGHLLEVYNFPDYWKNEHLKLIWYEFDIQSKGFKIERIDSTHAILVFKDSVDAAAALDVWHPDIQTRDHKCFEKGLRRWIKNHRELCLPFKQRPKRNFKIAKRLVSQALGTSVRETPTTNNRKS